MNFCASPFTSSTSTPTTVASCALSLRCQRSRIGASPRHGPHHEAQKFSTTTFPLYEESGTPAPPSSRASVVAGAAGPAPAAPGRASVVAGAGGRLPAASSLSIELSLPLDPTPYPSSATSASTPA